jgi:hypothetical protein
MANIDNIGNPRPTSLKYAFEYDSNQRLTKKVGGYLALSLSSGYGSYFTNEVHTSLTYKNNNVIIENYSTLPDLSIPKDTRIVTLNALNKIETKEIPDLLQKTRSKKEFYTYNQNKLVKIVTTLPNMPYDATLSWDYILSYVEYFYYDSKDNLIKTEYFEQRNRINKGQKIIRIFEDYDSSENPCKKLQLLDEFFYRSLSNNNFRKYTKIKYSNDILADESTSTWEFNYDANGQIISK